MYAHLFFKFILQSQIMCLYLQGKQKQKDMKLTFERTEEIFKTTNSQWEGDNALKGFMIIAKFFDIEKTSVLLWAGKDIIASVGVEEAIEAGMTEEDFTELAKLNWMINDDYLACFV